MLYQAYQTQSDLLAPLRAMAELTGVALAYPQLQESQTLRAISAWCDVIAQAQLTHVRPPFGIESVMVDGRFVMRDRKVLTMDEAAIIAEADKIGKRIWKQVKDAGPIPIPGRTKS